MFSVSWGPETWGPPTPRYWGPPPDIWGPWGGYWGGSRSPYSQMSGFSSQVHGWGTSASHQCVGLGIGVHLGAPQIFGSPGEVMGGVVLGPTGSRHPPRLWVGVLGHPTPRCLGSPHQVHGWGTSASPQCLVLGIRVHLGAPHKFGSPGDIIGGGAVLDHPTPRCLASPPRCLGPWGGYWGGSWPSLGPPPNVWVPPDAWVPPNPSPFLPPQTNRGCWRSPVPARRLRGPRWNWGVKPKDVHPRYSPGSGG